MGEAGAGQRREPVRAWRARFWRGRGGARERGGEALCEDWATDGRTGFLGQEARAMSTPDRRAMVERPGKDLSVRRQCTLLNLARSGVYRSKPVTGADDLALMCRIDELHLELPFYGSRRVVLQLHNERPRGNPQRVQLPDPRVGGEAVGP